MLVNHVSVTADSIYLSWEKTKAKNNSFGVSAGFCTRRNRICSFQARASMFCFIFARVDLTSTMLEKEKKRKTFCCP